MNSAQDAGDLDVSDALDRYVARQCAVVIAADPELRREADVVHDTRVAVRRLYSTLRVFTAVFDEPAASSLADELSWYAGLLGAVRDREVQRARMAAAVSDLPGDLVLGPVAEHIDQHLLSELRFHRAELAVAMAGERYQELLATLGRWSESAPYADHSGSPDVLALAQAAADKADRRLRRAVAAGRSGREAPDEVLHRSRKASKRARYAAELVEPLDAEAAAARIRHFKHVQSVLGAHQDSVVSADLLRLLGAGAGTLPGHNGFTYGVLYEREVEAGRAARREVAGLTEA